MTRLWLQQHMEKEWCYFNDTMGIWMVVVFLKWYLNIFSLFFTKVLILETKFYCKIVVQPKKFALAKEAMSDVETRLFNIPCRSPDLNPIKNILDLIWQKLVNDELEPTIAYESFTQFSSEGTRITMEAFSKEINDKTIASINKRIQNVMNNKRLNYKCMWMFKYVLRLLFRVWSKWNGVAVFTCNHNVTPHVATGNQRIF